MSTPSDPSDVRTSDFAYELPPELIAQAPAEPRDSARLMVLPRSGGPPRHSRFSDLPNLLGPGDLLVLNRTRVLPARLRGRTVSGAAVELLLLRQQGPGLWEALARPGRRLSEGKRVALEGGGEVEVERVSTGGSRVFRFLDGDDGVSRALRHGTVPLPPYIKGWQGDPERYQTVYADRPGSAAAPTAGLHFTPRLLQRLRERRVESRHLTLHVGVDTFRPIKVERAGEHQMHAEYYEIPAETAQAVRRASQEGRRVIAVGTTSVRALEASAESILAAGKPSELEREFQGWTRLFIVPGYEFKLVSGLITNFHLPRSTLLMLVSALAGRERLLAAYAEAIRLRYRFYSFGDAMLLI